MNLSLNFKTYILCEKVFIEYNFKKMYKIREISQSYNSELVSSQRVKIFRKRYHL